LSECYEALRDSTALGRGSDESIIQMTSVRKEKGLRGCKHIIRFPAVFA
jgi:hypothetical protein